MAKQTSGGYPKGGHATSLSGAPSAFSHIKKIGPEYNQAATGEREKAPLRHHAPRLAQAFHKAHEGPREKIGEPKRHVLYTPSGKRMAEVHSKLDREKRERNRQKDLQMKRRRDAKVTTARRFNANSLLPVHLRDQRAPHVFQKARQAQLKQRLMQKHSHSRDGHSR